MWCVPWPGVPPGRTRGSAWQTRGAAGVSLPEKWCCWGGLNSRPRPYQGRALPLSYSSLTNSVCSPHAPEVPALPRPPPQCPGGQPLPGFRPAVAPCQNARTRRPAARHGRWPGRTRPKPSLWRPPPELSTAAAISACRARLVAWADGKASVAYPALHVQNAATTHCARRFGTACRTVARTAAGRCLARQSAQAQGDGGKRRSRQRPAPKRSGMNGQPAASAFCTAAFSSGAVGVVRVPKAVISRPSLPIKYLWKFHCGVLASPSVAAAHR